MTIFWLIDKLGKSVRRMIREGSLALSRTSYKELSQRGIHPSSGVHHLFLKKETSFTQNSPASHWPSLVCSISPPLLNGFQSSLISLESYFQGESNAVCYEGQGLLLNGKRRQLPKLRHSDHPGDNWCISNPDLSFLDTSPYTWGVFPPFSIVGSHLWCGFQAETWVPLVVLQGFGVLE